jgi:hypothetical protein
MRLLVTPVYKVFERFVMMYTKYIGPFAWWLSAALEHARLRMTNDGVWSL